MTIERFRELEKILPGLREAYYNLSPKVSDNEFDILQSEFKELAKVYNPNHPEISAIGAAPPTYSVWEKVEHEIQMGSLEKVNSEGEFRKWAGGIKAKSYHITHKIDGSSMELVYKSGKLIRAATRGDGLIGEDVTINIAQIPNVPKNLNEAIDVTVRGEVVMMKDIFEEKYSEKYANPRNTAAGKIRDKKRGGVDCQNLNFIGYFVHYNGEEKPETMQKAFRFLERLGFQIPDFRQSENLEDIIYEFKATNRDRIPYEIDGMVVSVNELDHLDDLGSLNMRPRGQIAWKFEASTGVSEVVDVVWQVGLNGRCSPVAKIKPVSIEGVTITSVSLHNLNIFNDLKLYKNVKVEISRRNGVIPYIEKVIEDTL